MHDRTTSTTPAQEASGWHKSSYSNAPNDNCVEQGYSDDGKTVAVRDSKAKGLGTVLRVSPAAWAAFVDAVNAGEFPIAP
ncbi:DUF397 domain-containing protein [Kitasatospora sp. NPDC088548]|uniref:DUF397 domain-containing protein n=1 Tax=Kitasatospora sp. NPDC088548 TaxID=3364075 RepID=UPI00382FD5FE